MKQRVGRYYRRYADWVETLAPRQRTMVFAAAVLVQIGLCDALFLQPVSIRQKQLSQQLVQQQNDLRAVQAKTGAVTAQIAVDPDAENRVRAAALRQRLVQLDADMQGLQKGLVAPEKMALLLEEMLSHNRGLQLIRLRTLPARPLASREEPKAVQEGGSPSERAAAPETSLIYKHGVEITVQGGYLELVEYLIQLEKLSTRMYWGKAVLKTEAYPKSTLTLTLYTLSLDKAWLVV